MNAVNVITLDLPENVEANDKMVSIDGTEEYHFYAAPNNALIAREEAMLQIDINRTAELSEDDEDDEVGIHEDEGVDVDGLTNDPEESCEARIINLKANGQGNGELNDNNWDWTTSELTVENKENVSDLKEVIKRLENEKNNLLNELEQLDSENQQNLSELVKIREKLQAENNELKDENDQLKEQNKALVSAEEKIRRELNELRRTPTDSHNFPDSYQQKYENLIKVNQELKTKLDDTTKELSVLKSTHDTLKKAFEDAQKSGEKEVAELTEKLKSSELEQKKIHNELQKSREFVNTAELKSREDAENCQKLAFILESYEKQVSSLKKELDSISKGDNTQSEYGKNAMELLEKSCQELQSQLSEALESIDLLQSERDKLHADLEDCALASQQQSAQYDLQLKEKIIEISCLREQLKQHIENNTNIQQNYEHVIKLKEEIETLKNSLAEKTSEKEALHNIYVNIITDKIKRYIDSALLPSEQQYEASENPHITEFSRQVENLFKILLEFKQKCESLENELIKASNEKTNILNEKYNEIERLIQNSEVLSQEVLKKGETIKELESEITNLITSNDVLLSELDSYKNSGLQTISESNEDNMVLLETDLDNANKRIRELEEIIDSPSKTATSGTSNTSLDVKVNQKQEDYQELLNTFDDLKVDYDAVTFKLEEANARLKAIEAENLDLRTNLEKVKGDFENTDYQLSEAHIALESLKEELAAMKFNLDTLKQENKELKLQNMNSIDLKCEFNEVKEKLLIEENRRRELETQVRNLTEKLQGSKMAETSLKLQYDTLSKEHFVLVDAKNNLEQLLTIAKSTIADYEKNYTELLQNYDSVLLRCEKLSTLLHEKEAEILRIKNLEEQNGNLQKAFEEKADEMQQFTREHLLEKEEHITSLTANLRDSAIQNTELGHLTVQQKQQIEELISKEVSLQNCINDLESQIRIKDDRIMQLKDRLEDTERHNKQSEHELNKAEKECQTKQSSEVSLHDANEKFNILVREKEQLQTELKQSHENMVVLQQQLQELATSRNELINMVTIKHQESLNYHNEIQRLSDILNSEAQKYSQLEAKLIEVGVSNDELAKKNEEIDRLTDQNNFLKEKCDVFTKNLLEEHSKLEQLSTEKSGPSEKELSLLKQLERLQSHLMELQDRHTQELLQAEQNSAELQAKVTELEQRDKKSSAMYTSVSVRANQQVESLQTQLQLAINQREELRKKISDAEDLTNKQTAALANLQFVLEQFQKDKEKDVLRETERIRRQITVEKQVQDDLRKEIDNLTAQLEESKIGLQAASRLSDQLELLKKQNSGLKEEVSHLQQKLSSSLKTIHELTSQTDGKIDKTLIKNLIVGFLSSGHTNNNWNKDQTQILKLIATVLDFNQQDHDKVKLNQRQQGSWLGSILFPQPTNQNMSQESLSQAFVKFLENESKPRIVPSLLGEQSRRPSASTGSSKRSTPQGSSSPIILNEVVLPTFTDFGQSRNSSSILKDVLKDNNS